MKRPVWCAVAIVVSLFVLPMAARAQATYPCTRVSGGDCSAHAQATAVANGQTATPASESDFGATTAHATAGTTATAGGGIGHGNAMTTTGCITAVNGQTMVPQVNAACVAKALATVTSGTAGGTARSWGGVYAYYRVDPCSDPNADNPVLCGSIYVLYQGGNAGSAGQAWSSATGTVAGSDLYVSCQNGAAFVEGQLEMDGYLVEVAEYCPSGVNALYVTSEAVGVGWDYPLSAGVYLGWSSAQASESVASSEADWQGSIACWFEVEEH